MRSYQWITLAKTGVPESVFDGACKLWPLAKKTGVWGEGFAFECFMDDPALQPIAQNILKLCRDAGLSRSRHSGPNVYGHDAERCYDQSDLSSSEFLLLLRQRELQLEHERDAQGRPLLIASKAKPSVKIGRIYPNWIIVSDKVRRLLDSGAFVGLEFGEVVLKGKSVQASREPLWELKSSIVLPRLGDRNRLIQIGTGEPQPFAGDYSKIIMISDPPYRNPEVHYRRSDLSALGNFDIARTFENYIERHPALIVSQRFYQFCQNNKVPLNVQPVRIDPD